MIVPETLTFTKTAWEGLKALPFNVKVFTSKDSSNGGVWSSVLVAQTARLPGR
jgi:hypothetical protein